MALSDEVSSRYSAQQLRSLTNPDAPAKETADSARLGLAATDAQADFPIYAQAHYDGTDAAHVSIGVKGVIAYLMSRGGSAAGVASTTIKEFRDDLAALAKVSSRKRITPTTDGVLVPSSESDEGANVRPYFDREHFDGVAPDRYPVPGDG